MAVRSDDPHPDFLPSDCFPMNTGTDGPILSDFARKSLELLLSPAGEFWPVQLLNRRYWWFNCLACVDALDTTLTDGDWETISGDWGTFRWMTSVTKLALRPTALTLAPSLFRLPEFPQGVLLGTELLQDAVTRSGLVGFRFDCLWSLSHGGVQNPPGFGLQEENRVSTFGELAHKRAQASATLAKRSEG